MMPPSYRIEKAIYCLWHGFIGLMLLMITQQDFIDWFTPTVDRSTAVGIAGLFAIYGIWQTALFFLHGYNAISGETIHPFNFGSWRSLFQYQIFAFMNPTVYDGATGHRNIDAVIRFREAKMGAISTSEGAELLVETSALDQIASGGYGRNHQQAARLLNAKLGALSQSQGLEYMRGRQLN